MNWEPAVMNRLWTPGLAASHFLFLFYLLCLPFIYYSKRKVYISIETADLVWFASSLLASLTGAGIACL